MKQALTFASLFLTIALGTNLFADDYGNLKIDKVGPLDKVGPIAPLGKSKDSGSKSSPAQDSTSATPNSPGNITIQGTGSDPVDFSSRTPTSSQDSGSGESVEDVLERMSLGGHKKEGGGGGSGSSDAEEDGGVKEALKTLFAPQPNYQDLNSAKVLAPIERPERDAPAGMMKVSMPEAPSKDPRKNFPAQAGGSSSCPNCNK